MAKTIIVVPCFNEFGRLPVSEFTSFSGRAPGVDFLLVNDGSTDDTLKLLRELERWDSARFAVVDQQPNRGKAEAVRQGMQEAFKRGASYAGYWDADLATPLDEIPRFVGILEEHPSWELVMGARVQLLGRSIQRSALRHYLGRVFATIASSVLRLPVYDTQCGAKLFRVSPGIAALFGEPFCTSWVFDVEIIARLIRDRRGTSLPGAAEVIREIPLRRWHDVAGSKVRPHDFIKGALELARIHRRYLRGAAPRRAARA